MDKDVTTPNFLQKHTLSSIVEEVGIVPRDIVVLIKDKAQGKKKIKDLIIS